MTLQMQYRMLIQAMIMTILWLVLMKLFLEDILTRIKCMYMEEVEVEC